MNFSQLHERLRLEVLSRIEREVITASLLASKSGLQQPHISNFLRSKRRLSLSGLDRILAALGLSVDELLPAPGSPLSATHGSIPIVSQQAAIFDDAFRPATIAGRVLLPPDAPIYLQSEYPARRSSRERFVAVGLTPAQARPMEPVLAANSLLVLDRHAPIPARDTPALHNIYAMIHQGQMHFSYVTRDEGAFILRPHAASFPLQRLPVPPHKTPSDYVIGRVCASVAYV